MPVVGARRLGQVTTLAGSNSVSVSPEELTRITELVPRGAAQGARYPSQHVADLDSER